MSTVTLFAHPGRIAVKTKRKTKRKTNPRVEGVEYSVANANWITRPSQATKKKPTRRLVKRRGKTLKGQKGFFANPVRHGYTVTVLGAEIATFKTMQHAKQYGQALANHTGKSVSIRK